MKNVLSIGITLLIMLLGACGQKDAEPVKDVQKDKQTEKTEEFSAEPEEESEDAETDVVDETKIETSMYEYAENIDVTDALEINDHITLMIDMPESNTKGLAFQHVLNQTYDFLQQDTAKEAKTIGINIRQGGNKIAMFTVHPDQFKEADDIPMVDLVLDTSIIDMAHPEVEEYANTMGLKLNKE